ncbi:MAG: citrate (Si)-synthase [Deltaproteobacteria bacterium]|nr:citrate (Si)-synthase [Deltaproteobacteria bacterium]
MGDKATLKVGDKTVELPIIVGTENEVAVDIRRLRAETGVITYDPGFANTGSCQSDITFIDGEKGILRYGGYPIEQLAEKSSFLEVCMLLLNRELPSAAELDEFTAGATRHTMLHEDVVRFFRSLPKDAHPMAVCSTVVAALSTFYPHLHDLDSEKRTQSAIIRLIAKLPTIAAITYKHSKGQPTIYPDNGLDYCSNFLRMMFATPCDEFDPDPVVARALDQLLILHADHEQNCSTSTVRLVGSSLPHLFACIAAGIGALWGPLHGGANQKVIEMLERIEQEEGSAEKFLNRAKDKDGSTRLMGFGHRVYKNHDPRATILRKTSQDVLNRLGIKSRLLEIAMDLEERALNDEYFVERKLYPNVDFYSGIIYNAIGIPVPMFTVLFAMGRLPGWIAQWQEMHGQEDFRIGRPRQVYTGALERDYTPIASR